MGRSAWLWAGMTLLLGCSVSYGDQFVLFDVTFTFTNAEGAVNTSSVKTGS